MTPDQRRRAVELQRQGWTQRKIAGELKLARSTVARWLARHGRAVDEQLRAESAAIRAKQVEQLEWAAEEAAAAWEDSKRPLVPIPGVRPPGDPRLLTLFRGLLADVRLILGLDVPTELARARADKLAQTGATVQTEVIVHRVDRQQDRDGDLGGWPGPAPLEPGDDPARGTAVQCGQLRPPLREDDAGD